MPWLAANARRRTGTRSWRRSWWHRLKRRKSCCYAGLQQPSTSESRNASYTAGSRRARRLTAARTYSRRRGPCVTQYRPCCSFPSPPPRSPLPPPRASRTVNELVAQGKFCSATARAALHACRNQTLDDYWIGVGICINESDGRDRNECFVDLKDSRDEATDECAAQHKARTDLCKAVGEGRYDPEFEETRLRHATSPT